MMPIEFRPAAPFAPAIDEQFGRTTQWNRFAPLLADQYAQAANRQTQASIATANNQTQASATSAGLEGRRTAQIFELDAEREARAQQAAVAMEMQQRQQQFELVRQSIPISRQEEQQNAARMNGLVEIERQVKEGYLSPEQAADARYELMTGINAFQRRQQFQQSQAVQQQAKMREQEIASMNKQQAMGEQFQLEMAEKGITIKPFFDPETGRARPLAYDSKTGKLYNPFLEHAGSKGEKETPVSAYDDGSGGFSYKKALPEAKAEAEAAYPIIKDEGGKDANATRRAEYTQEMIRKREDEHRTGMQSKSQQRQGGQAPVTAPQQQVPASFEQDLAKLKERGFNDTQVGHAKNILEGIQELTAKSKSTPLSGKEKADLKALIQNLESFQ